MKNSVFTIYFILGFVFLTSSAQATELFSRCTYDVATYEVTGSNIDALSPVASISKLMTAHWALGTYGSSYQFKEQVFFQEVNQDIFDVHIQGSLNPFFNNDFFSWLVVQLNRRQIFQVRNLTFDENFIYMHDLDQLAAYDAIDFKSRYNDTAKALRTGLNQLKKVYAHTQVKLKSNARIELPEKVRLSVGRIRRGQPEEALSDGFSLFSAPLVDLLAQMNKTSNNHVADFFFESLGGAKAFAHFMKDSLDLTEKEIRFINGSGGPFLDKKSGKKFYNYASCRTVIKVILDIQKKLNKENLNLWSVMTAVDPAGSKNDRDLNPVNDYYSSEITAYSVVGKTGTISPIIGFAGLVSTQNTRFLIAEFIKTKGSSQWNTARSEIRADLENLIVSNGGPRELPVQPKTFLSFSVQMD